MFSSHLIWTQIANQIPARKPVCLQAHTPRPFGAHSHGVKEIITFQMFGEKRLLLRSHVISDFGALERGSHMLGGSHEGRQEDSCPRCKVTTEPPPPTSQIERMWAHPSSSKPACSTLSIRISLESLIAAALVSPGHQHRKRLSGQFPLPLWLSRTLPHRDSVPEH